MAPRDVETNAAAGAKVPYQRQGLCHRPGRYFSGATIDFSRICHPGCRLCSIRRLSQWTAFDSHPFGVFGLIGFVWLVIASLRVLYYHYRLGDPALHKVNTFLIAAYVAKILIFVFIFGGLSSDLYAFLGLVGLSISLNGAPQTATEPESSPALT